ncbi:hypothetical protein BN7874_010 [Phage NCTB]|jgi:hypothetical protein|nr:hypothetical protein BN7874_010 [Phage NCTB]
MIKVDNTLVSIKVRPLQLQKLAKELGKHFDDLESRELILNNGRVVGYTFKDKLDELEKVLAEYLLLSSYTSEAYKTRVYNIAKLRITVNTFDASTGTYSVVQLEDKFH